MSNKINNPLILGFGVEIWVSKLKLRTVVRESIIIPYLKVPKNPRKGFPIFEQNPRWPPKKISFLNIVPQPKLVLICPKNKKSSLVSA